MVRLVFVVGILCLLMRHGRVRSFMIALHTFNLLFLRMKMTALGQWVTVAIGWTAVLFVIIIGPLAIQTPEKGPYFGISGYWFVFVCLYSHHTPHLPLCLVQVLDNRRIPR